MVVISFVVILGIFISLNIGIRVLFMLFVFLLLAVFVLSFVNMIVMFITNSFVIMVVIRIVFFRITLAISIANITVNNMTICSLAFLLLISVLL